VNDPHVVALHYKVLIGPGYDFSKAPSLSHSSEPEFDVRLHIDRAEFTMKQHFATEQEALSVVQPFVNTWNIGAGLELLPNRFWLEYSHPEIVDRSPTPGVVALHARNFTIGSPESGRPALTVPRDHFPSPPTNFQASPDVTAMYSQFRAHREGGIPLAHMAYFLLTVLEQRIPKPQSKRGRNGKRTAAANKFHIDKDVLDKIGELTSERGGPTGARKFEGSHVELTAQEAAWLEAAVKMMIRRAGEIAANPTGPHPQITMADLPTV
jgi:hypothetical protein